MSHPSRATVAKLVDYSGGGILTQGLWIVLFASATAVVARLEIPHIPIPYTLQTLTVLLAGAFLGARNAAISQILYLVVGLLGAPVFAQGGAGLARLVGPTGGYLAGFPIGAAAIGFLIPMRKTLGWTLLSMGAGLLVIFVCGTVHLYSFYIHDIVTAFVTGFLAFSWWDLLKLGAAAMIYHEVAKRWPRVQ